MSDSKFYIFFLPSDLFPQILHQNQSMIPHHFTHLISFSRFLVIAHINLIYFIRLFINIVHIFMQTQFSHFQVFYNIIHLYFTIFTYLFSLIRAVVVTHIHQIYFVRFFLKIYIFLWTQFLQFQDFYIFNHFLFR